MSTTSALFADVIASNPVGSYGIACAICFAGGILVGGLICTVLWFRLYLDEGMRAIESYAGKEWGE